jgi:alkylation response protein AidB-like acyl-CoA dehydrogenase
MDFAWSEEQAALRQTVVRFAQQELNHDVIDLDKRSEFPWDSWKRCASMGIQGLPVPMEFGGGGTDILTTVCALEGLGYGCRDNGLIFSINAHMWSSEIPLMTFGTRAQKERYLPRLTGGDLIGAHAMTEPTSGSDAYGLQTRAVRKADRYVLNGRKMFITNAPVAGLTIVFGRVENAPREAAISAFLVDCDTPGFSVGQKLDKMGLRTSPMGELVLEDCEVPEENLLGQVGSGPTIFSASMEWERICIVASKIGAMQRLLELSTRYAKERQQFGQPIGKFQAIAGKIAEMEVRLETSRLILYKAAWLKKTGRHPLREASITKLHVSEAYIQTCLDALQIHGGYGYMTETQIERELRDALAGTIYSGTSEIQKVIIAGLRGL